MSDGIVFYIAGLVTGIGATSFVWARVLKDREQLDLELTELRRRLKTYRLSWVPEKK